MEKLLATFMKKFLQKTLCEQPTVITKYYEPLVRRHD